MHLLGHTHSSRASNTSRNIAKTLLKYASLGLLLTTSLPVLALSGRYVSVSTGVVLPNRMPRSIDNSSVVSSTEPTGLSFYQMQNVYWNNTFKTGVPISIAYGHYFSPSLRVEGEFLYQYMQRKTSGTFAWAEANTGTGLIYTDPNAHPIPLTTTGTNVVSLMLNGYYDVKPIGPWTPFVGVGIGPAWVSSKNAVGNGSFTTNSGSPNDGTFNLQSTSQTLSSAAFAYQAKAGMQYFVNKNVHLFLMYRMFATGTMTVKSSKFTTTPGISGPVTFVVPSRTISGLLDNNFEVGLSYFFD